MMNWKFWCHIMPRSLVNHVLYYVRGRRLVDTTSRLFYPVKSQYVQEGSMNELLHNIKASNAHKCNIHHLKRPSPMKHVSYNAQQTHFPPGPWRFLWGCGLGNQYHVAWIISIMRAPHQDWLASDWIVSPRIKLMWSLDMMFLGSSSILIALKSRMGYLASQASGNDPGGNTLKMLAPRLERIGERVYNTRVAHFEMIRHSNMQDWVPTAVFLF